MPIIWRLHVPLRNKVILSLIFGLGSLICIVRIKKLFLYTTAPMMALPFDSDGPHNNSEPVLYTVLESCLGVICACLVIMKPIFTDSKFFNSLSRKISSWTTSSHNSSETGPAMAAKGRRTASWELGAARQKSSGRDLRIMKTCEIDVEMEAAMVAEKSRGQRYIDMNKNGKKQGAMMVDEKSTSESTVSTSPRGRGTEAQIRQGA
ncbi:MAG: hypothetical protein L6R38_008636 [Xanthoria sp. 2 TBL-2021]|nr:MAG: hypothetical protein L6R38_008636 [Xanthoria sp. 2 TBL-2021]